MAKKENLFFSCAAQNLQDLNFETEIYLSTFSDLNKSENIRNTDKHITQRNTNLNEEMVIKLISVIQSGQLSW